METNSPELSFLSLFSFLSFFIFLIFIKYSNKIGDGILLDKDFQKPQAFHSEAISRGGGLVSIILLIFFVIIYNFLFSKILLDYLFICTSLFFIGFLEDIKINFKPHIRLFTMITVLLFCINFFDLNLQSVELNFLEVWLDNQIFLSIFVLLCFLFIINGANLIDGFNGLLAINIIIINSVLLFINLENSFFEFSIFLMAQITILICFLLFNFPKAKIFFGDGGSYLFGSLVALNTIYTNNLNPQISSFFFCILLFYLFFEVFFSFFRKILSNKSPLIPDGLHLHMLIYKLLKHKSKINNTNALNSFVINSFFFALIMPALYFQENGLVCKYWFFTLLILYCLAYIQLKKVVQKITGNLV